MLNTTNLTVLTVAVFVVLGPATAGIGVSAGTPLVQESDSDDDGLSDAREDELGTDPNDPDTDGDEYWDGDEHDSGTDPTDPEDYPHRDSDGDKYTDRDEVEQGTDPHDPDDYPADADTDGDKLTDSRENAIGTDPNDEDTDGDEYWDGHEWRSNSDPTDASNTPESGNDGDDGDDSDETNDGDGADTNDGDDSDNTNDGDNAEENSDDNSTDSDGPSPTKVNSTAYLNGTLAGNASADWYAFDVEAGQVIRLVGYIQSSGQITIYGPSDEVLENNSFSGDGYIHGAVADETGEYRVRIKNHVSDVNATYEHDLTTVDRDPAGANDDRTGAVELDDGETVRDHRAETETDWYAISAEAGDRITASLTIPDGENWPEYNNLGLQIHAPNGTAIGNLSLTPSQFHGPSNQTFVRGGDTDALHRAIADTDGTYYVRVTQDPHYFEGYTAYDLTLNASGSTPTNESDADADGDGLPDTKEEELGTDPNDPDTDGDRYWDGDEQDSGTDPTDAQDYPHRDSDGDKYTDRDEIEHDTDPDDPEDYPDQYDSDGDKLTDSREEAIGTDPDDRDTDGDEYWDGHEWRSNTDPTDDSVTPA